jgi:TetR/AcrR family transcriptional regulator, cholesterol catabolism regulator
VSEIARRRAAAAKAAKNNPGYQERLEVIRRAAGKVFHEQGFSRTKLNDIAEAAGIDRASLYYYVGSKEQLFRDVVSEAVTANIEAARAVRAMDLPPREKLARMIESLMKSFETYYPYMHAFVQEDMTKLATDAGADSEWSRTVQNWNSEYFTLVRATISEGIMEGSFRTTLPPGMVANCVIGMLNHSHLWFRPDGVMDAEEIGQGMAHLVLMGLASTT